MSARHRKSGLPADASQLLFAVWDAPSVTGASPEQVSAYVAALEARCNALWGYIQGYDCNCDPVVRFLASELGITVDSIAGARPGPAAD